MNSTKSAVESMNSSKNKLTKLSHAKHTSRVHLETASLAETEFFLLKVL